VNGQPSSILKAIGRLAKGLGFLGQLAVACMVLTICYDVIMRYILKAPTTWSLEVNTFLVIFITLIPAADVLREDSHLRIGFFISRFNPGFRGAVRRLGSLLGAFFCAMMTYNGLNMAFHAFKYDQRMSTPLGTPMFVPYLFIPLGFIALGLSFLARAAASRPEREKEPEAASGLKELRG